MKKFLSVLVIFGLVTLAPATVGAQGISDAFCNGSGKQTAVCKDVQASNSGNPLFGKDGILTITARILSFLVGFAAVLAIIIAGISYILSGGDAQKTATAKNAIIYAVIGLGVAVFAQAIVALVLSNM